MQWSGYEWTARDGGQGQPGVAGWSANNAVVTPDGLVLKVTNLTGRQPVGCEVRTVRRGFGYGRYRCVVEKPNLPGMHKSLVFGGLFTYDYNADAAPGYREIDMCESAAWGGSGWDVHTNHSFWHDDRLPPGKGNVAETFVADSAPVQTHEMVWSKGRLEFTSHAGARLLKQTIIVDERVPTPGREQLVLNFWVFGGGDSQPLHAPADHVIVREVAFTPEQRYDDVPVGSPNYAGIEYVASEGLMAPKGTKFRPDDPVTRGQLASILRRLSKRQ